MLDNEQRQLRVINLGTQYEVYMLPAGKRTPGVPVRKLAGGRYVNTDTGEITDATKHTRATELSSIHKTVTKIRHLIDLNFDGSTNEVVLCLTYEGNTDRILTPPDAVNSREQLTANEQAKTACMNDIWRFMNKLRYHFQDTGHQLKYIWVIQPHASGQIHFHVLIKRLNSTAFTPNLADLQRLWGHGETGVEIEQVQDIRKLGAYISAGMLNDTPDPNDPDKLTHYERLKYYPANMKIYSTSRNLTRPQPVTMTVKQLAAKGLDLNTPDWVSTRTNTDTAGNEHPHHHLFYDKPA